MHQRAFRPDDRDPMIALLLAYRAAGYVMREPTVWRFQLLLESRVWDMARDVRLWEDDRGQLAACALLWKRRPTDTVYALERVLHPATPGTGLAESVLEWAVARTTSAAMETGQAHTLAVLPLEQHADQDTALLASMEFARNTEGHVVYMRKTLPGPTTARPLPEGFHLGPLAEGDLERYRAAYGFTAVSEEVQRALLRHPDYQHLVITAPDGTFAAYLECSFSREEWGHHPERVGWIDYVQTQPEYLRRGLGRALMLAGFDHLWRQGATSAMLITGHNNAPALALYQSLGMDLAGAEYAYLHAIDAPKP